MVAESNYSYYYYLFPPVLKLFYQVNDRFIFHSIFHFSQNFLHSHFICEHNFLHHGGIFCQSREFVNVIKATSDTKPDFFIYDINVVINVKQNEQYRDHIPYAAGCVKASQTCLH